MKGGGSVQGTAMGAISTGTNREKLARKVREICKIGLTAKYVLWDGLERCAAVLRSAVLLGRAHERSEASCSKRKVLGNLRGLRPRRTALLLRGLRLRRTALRFGLQTRAQRGIMAR